MTTSRDDIRAVPPVTFYYAIGRVYDYYGMVADVRLHRFVLEGRRDAWVFAGGGGTDEGPEREPVGPNSGEVRAGYAGGLIDHYGGKP